MQTAYQELGQGVTCIDALYQRKNLACCYLIREGQEAAIIDTGTANTLPHTLRALEQSGLSPEQVKYVIPTHVHLDHAGGAGQLMDVMPNAQLIIHPVGARHMIDPEKLIAGTVSVYGEEAFKRDYKEILPIDESRVLMADDGLTVNLEGRPLVCIDTPGHARHHIAIWDEQSRGLFTGDTFGMSYREFDSDKGVLGILPSTPIDFDPESWRTTLKKLIELKPERIYLTHFCAIDKPMEMASQMFELIDIYVDIALNSDPDNRYSSIKTALKKEYLKRIEEHGCKLSLEQIDALLGMDIGLCAQGLEVWLKRREKRAQSPA